MTVQAIHAQPMSLRIEPLFRYLHASGVNIEHLLPASLPNHNIRFLLSLRAVCDRNQGTCDNLSATAPVATATAVTPTATTCKVGGCSLFGGH